MTHDRTVEQLRRARQLLAQAGTDPVLVDQRIALIHVIDTIEATLVRTGYPICPYCAALDAEPCAEDCPTQ